MKKIIYLLFAVLIFMEPLSSQEKHSGNVFPYEFKFETLDNGLKVYLIKVPSDGIVAYYTIVRTGSRDEYELGHSGFAHFFEHMMFRGTKKYPGSVYDSIVTTMGADANAYTTDDYTCYHLNFTKPDLEKVMELESDRFQNLFYEEAAFQTESGAVYGEYRKSKTNPFFLLEEKIAETAFDVHTYKHTTMGFEKDIAAMPTMYEYSRNFLKRYYRP
ncbi:MAG: pitrilysin family protein, partial [Bacteroidota bacterium]